MLSNIGINIAVKCCHGDIVTTPALPRVIPGSSYSDELILDVTLSKYCDLIPVERYCQMAARQGIPGIPPHSLITTILKFAEFLRDSLRTYTERNS